MKQYVLVIEHLTGSLYASLMSMRAVAGYDDLELLVLTSKSQQVVEMISTLQARYTTVVACDFSSQQAIEHSLGAYLKNVKAVICRGDQYIQYLRMVLPVLPKRVLAASTQSLEITTNKRLMRQAFAAYCPEQTIRFVRVKDATATSCGAVEEAIAYPVIVKPADLASSLLIQSCASRQELQAALSETFATIQETYRKEGRRARPQVIVEEYLEGDFYSIDAYIGAANDIQLCPPVAYQPAKNRGINDFFIYNRSLPSSLSATDLADVQYAAMQAVRATGLTFSAAHIELVKTIKGWKIIELGPRLGRFRHKLYKQAYGIDHSLNDLKLHLGLPPVIPETLKEYCAAYSIYPSHEGILRSIHGISELSHSVGVGWYEVAGIPGQRALFAKHGGHALAEIMAKAPTESGLAALARRIDTDVYAVVD